MSQYLNNEEIIEALIVILGHPTRASLYRDLEVSKQSLSQFTKQTGIDINNKIITRLIEKLEE